MNGPRASLGCFPNIDGPQRGSDRAEPSENLERKNNILGETQWTRRVCSVSRHVVRRNRTIRLNTHSGSPVIGFGITVAGSGDRRWGAPNGQFSRPVKLPSEGSAWRQELYSFRGCFATRSVRKDRRRGRPLTGVVASSGRGWKHRRAKRCHILEFGSVVEAGRRGNDGEHRRR